MNNDGQNFLSFLVGFVVGGLIGAAVALLYAPQAGADTRAQIKDKSIELREHAQDLAMEYQAKAQQSIDQLSAKVTELQSKVQGQTAPMAPPPPSDTPAI
jgi:gas vesicle protein